MKDPKENDDQTQDANGEAAQQQSDNNENTNWDEHQQVDEEGNEVDPDDIK